MTKKHSKKKHWTLENILYLVGGWVSARSTKKKKLSVGLFSTFRHPLSLFKHKSTVVVKLKIVEFSKN